MYNANKVVIDRVGGKLAVSFIIVVLALMVTATTLAANLFRDINRKNEDKLSNIIGIIASESVSRISFSGKYHLRLWVVEMKKKSPEIAFISVEDRSGVIIANSDPLYNDIVPVFPEDVIQQKKSMSINQTIIEEHVHDGKLYKEVVIPYTGGLDVRPSGVVRVGIDLQNVRMDQIGSYFVLVLFVILLTTLGVWAVIILSRFFNRSIIDLALNLQGILNYAPIAICVVDSRGYIKVNSIEFNNLFGLLNKNKSIKEEFYDKLKNGEFKLVKDEDLKIFDSKGFFNLEIELIISGVYKALHVSKFPIAKNSKGEGVLFCIFIHDVTDRNKAVAELSNAKDYIYGIINSMPSVLVGVDSNGFINQWNLEAERVTGVARDFAVNKFIVEIFPRVGCRIETIYESIRSNEVKRDTKIKYIEDGEWRYEDITIYPVISNESSGAVIRIDDVTDKVRMEDMMIQSEKMLSVGGLAAGMAHEINNPLSGILQGLQILEKRIFDVNNKANLEAAAKTGLDISVLKEYLISRDVDNLILSIREAGVRAAGIVRNMLSFARMDKGDKQLSNITTLLDTTINLVMNDYNINKSYDFKQIEIVKEYAPDLPCIRCEPSKIQQVFLNILKNGAEAMSVKKAENYQPRFTIRSYRDSRNLCVEIEDNGPGMDKYVRSRIFEPFFTTKQVGVGTGLGMSVSYFIITSHHNGTMIVESELGEYSNFIITFPIEKSE